MGKVKTAILTLILLSIMAISASGQTTEARASIDTSSIMIGDQINLTLELDLPRQSEIYWPDFVNDTVAAGVEIVKESEVDSSEISESWTTIRQILTITSFDTGTYVIRPVPFEFRLKDDTAKYAIQSNPVFLEVTEPEVDLSSDIKALKSPLEAPVTFQEIMAFFLKYVLPVLLFLLLAAVVLFIILRRKKDQPLFRIRSKPHLPPHQQALKDLEALRLKKLWQAGRVKEYHSELTDIVRTYIEGRFGVQALEMTTEEIIDGLRSAGSHEETIEKLKQTLVLADLVKFAKERPLPSDNDNSLSKSIEFINDTKPEPVTEKDENQAEIKEEV